jgi:hypothetical protein
MGIKHTNRTRNGEGNIPQSVHLHVISSKAVDNQGLNSVVAEEYRLNFILDCISPL